jgi:hypothetical protein
VGVGNRTSAAATSTAAGGSSGANGIRQSSPNCADVDGQLITDAQGTVYTVHCSSDGDGNDVGMSQVSSGGYLTCETLCDSTPGCGVWVFVGTNSPNDASGPCYMKQTGAARADGNANKVTGIRGGEAQFSSAICSDGATVQDSGRRAYTLHCGYDTSGANISNTHLNNQLRTNCEAACDAATGCTNWVMVFNGDGSSDCYLKSGSNPSLAPSHGNFMAGIYSP